VTSVRSDDRADDQAIERSPVTSQTRPKRVGRELGTAGLLLLVLLCAATLLLGFLNKDRCTGPTFDQWGRSQPDFNLRYDRDVCYSDIQFLWLGRDINEHVFPYVSGGISPAGQLTGGAIEYPVLTGVLIWLGAFFAHNDHQFLTDSAILLAPFALVTAWLLGRLARWRALVWALGPPLVLYAFHNWDLAVVLTAVAAVYVLHRGWGAAGANIPLLRRAVVSSVLLGIGFAFKLYPAIFVLPLMFYVATGGDDGADMPQGKRWDIAGAIKVGLAAIGTVVLINLPFMLAGFQGWKASFIFQGDRQVDITTNSIWFWGFRPESDPANTSFQHLVSILSPTAILLSFVLACVLGWRRYRREGTYPWVAVSAAMLCGFLLLHKVHSPQYTLWLVPMFVLMRVRWGWILAYGIADLALGIGLFRYYYVTKFNLPYGIYDGFATQSTVIGVWGQAALLVGLFFAFLNAPCTVYDPVVPRTERVGALGYR
jgi:hypothetical protein